MIEIEVSPDEFQLKSAARLAAEEVFTDDHRLNSSRAKHEAYLDIIESESWVALVDGIVRGMIAFRMAEHTRSAQIYTLATDRESRARKLRVGSTLIEYFEDEMRYRNIGHITLSSLPEATGFYETHKYMRVGGLEYAKWLD